MVNSSQKIQSPWQEANKIQWPVLMNDLTSDVAIIGGGISGIATLYYLMTETNKHVVLVEKNTIASGATGNNAGFAWAHIERPVSELVEEFGFDLVKEAFMELDQGWNEYVRLNNLIGLEKNIELLENAGFAFTDLATLQRSLLDADIFRKMGRKSWEFFISEEFELTGVGIHRVPRTTLLEKLQTIDSSYIGLLYDSVDRARTNTYLFCQRLLEHIRDLFPDRFEVYEQTEITHIDQNVLHHAHGTLVASDVILCTNGYSSQVTPRAAYMGALSSSLPDGYSANFINLTDPLVPYWHVTHCDFLTLIAGPDYPYPELDQNEWNQSFSQLSQFFQKTYGLLPSFSHQWFGLQGYTQNGLRWVGQNKKNSHLWYNLGCNGIGIVHSMAAGKRIARLLSGESLPPSLFSSFRS